MKRDTLAVSLLFLWSLLLHLPVKWHILYHWDSINFALSLSKFDVAAGQPHVPGYIVYVYFARLVNGIFHNPQTSLVVISAVSSALAVAAIYFLGVIIFDRQTGFWAALFLLSSPLFLFYGEIALPHTLDAFIVLLCVTMLTQVLHGKPRWAIPAAICLGIAGGLRPQTELFLAPLALYCGWQLGWRRGLTALAVLVAIDFAWCIPLIQLSGGLSRYLEVMGAFTAAFNTTTAILTGGTWGLMRNLRKLVMYTLYGWGLVSLLAISAWAWLLVDNWQQHRSSSKKLFLLTWFKKPYFWFFFLWAAPTLGYYLFIHMGQQGLVFVFLPAIFLLSAAAIVKLNWHQQSWGRVIVAAVIMVNASLFLFAPAKPLGDDRLKLLTFDTLQQHDTHYQVIFSTIRREFSPNSTLLLSSQWRFPQYYLPEYSFIPYSVGSRWEVNAGNPTQAESTSISPRDLGLKTDAQGMFTIVLVDDEILPFNQSVDQTNWLNLQDGSRLGYIEMTPQQALLLTPQNFSIKPAQ
ncbi:MAG: hypothetical protein GYA34_03630 [Chloroflexi bacterium]|nr:hypothetical protein [Chloroflexota bacterium]